MVREFGGGLELAHRIGWHNVALWARHLPEGSATWRALNPELATWSSQVHVAAMLADLIDCTIAVARTIAQAHSKHRLPPSKPYPRPGAKNDEERIGSGALTLAEFDAWYYDTEEAISG